MRRASVLVLFASAPLWAQDHPNYSGAWNLSLDESDFAGQAAPKSRSETIEQKGSAITEDVREEDAQGSRRGVIHFNTGGTATSNTVMGTDLKSAARWDGQDLVIHTDSHAKGADASYDDRWTLSLDGSILTVRRHFGGKGIRADQMLVYHKFEAPTE